VTAAARASTCAYNTVASKFVTNYRVDKIKEGSSRSCNNISTILGPTRYYWILALANSEVERVNIAKLPGGYQGGFLHFEIHSKEGYNHSL